MRCPGNTPPSQPVSYFLFLCAAQTAASSCTTARTTSTAGRSSGSWTRVATASTVRPPCPHRALLKAVQLLLLPDNTPSEEGFPWLPVKDHTTVWVPAESCGEMGPCVPQMPGRWDVICHSVYVAVPKAHECCCANGGCSLLSWSQSLVAPGF